MLSRTSEVSDDSASAAIAATARRKRGITRSAGTAALSAASNSAVFASTCSALLARTSGAASARSWARSSARRAAARPLSYRFVAAA